MGKDTKNHWFIAAIFCGLVSLFIGISVIYGWVSHNETLIQVFPNFVPMQFNTALGFVLLGLGMICYKRFYLGAHVCGVLAALLGFITTQEWALGIDVGLDQLFMQHYITEQTPVPGRMAPNTAICFAILGSSIGLVDSPLIRKIMAIISVMIASMAFFGYIVSDETFFRWSQLTSMAIHTSIGFIIVSLGIFAMNGFDRRVLKMQPPAHFQDS